MVEIFKTSVTCSSEAAKIISHLQTYIPEARINFDLTDCDNILRIESEKVPISMITETLESLGHSGMLLS
jgi:hypothetical protein